MSKERGRTKEQSTEGNESQLSVVCSALADRETSNTDIQENTWV